MWVGCQPSWCHRLVRLTAHATDTIAHDRPSPGFQACWPAAAALGAVLSGLWQPAACRCEYRRTSGGGKKLPATVQLVPEGSQHSSCSGPPCADA